MGVSHTTLSYVRLKKNLTKPPIIRKGLREVLLLKRNVMRLGILPFRLSIISKIPRYLKDAGQFKSTGGKITSIFPILSDYGDSAGNAKGHYFHQDLLVSSFIYLASPKRHIDVGSRIDGFVAHVAAFRKIEILDIRDMDDTGHKNIEFKKVNLMHDSEVEITDSLSCLHTIEHFGLGRYGDPIQPDGHLRGWENLIKMVKLSR